MRTVAVVAKPFWKSRTFRVNVLLALPPALAAITDLGLAFTESQWYALLVIVVNLALRVVTTNPVALSTSDQVQRVEAPPV